MQRSLTILFAVHGLIASLAMNGPSHADSIAVSFSLPQSPAAGNVVNGVDGFDFTPNVTLTVTALGWYDHDGDGLLQSHPVGIYLTSTQTLVAPVATVSNSSILDVSSNFRFEPVTPFILLSGVTYTLIGYGEGPPYDPYVTNPSEGVTFGLGFDYIRPRSAASSGFEFPTAAGEVGVINGLYFGPNFQYLVVPEPTAACLLGLGAGLALSSRRRSRVHRL